jgi:hypothetical protein
MRQRIDDPILFPICDDHASLAEIREVFGNLHLRLVKDALKVANAER